MTPYIIVVVCCAAVALLHTATRAHAVGSMSTSAISGVLGLAIINLFSASGAALLALNIFNVCFCAVFGIPGLIGLLLLKTICVI